MAEPVEKTNAEEFEQKMFDIFAIIRIVDNTYKQFSRDLEAVQFELYKRLKILGLKVNLKATIEKSKNKSFHEDAYIVCVTEDEMEFILYNGFWIFGNNIAGYICMRVTPDHIEVMKANGTHEVKAG